MTWLLLAGFLLTWQDNSDNEDGFVVERRTGAGAYAVIAITGPDVVSLNDPVQPSSGNRQTFTWRVKAFNAQGDSGYSNEAGVTCAKRKGRWSCQTM
jgi:uncharacterized protein